MGIAEGNADPYETVLHATAFRVIAGYVKRATEKTDAKTGETAYCINELGDTVDYHIRHTLTRDTLTLTLTLTLTHDGIHSSTIPHLVHSRGIPE